MLAGATTVFICAPDFSRRGYSILPLLSTGDGAKRTASFEDGRDFWLQENERMDERGFDSLGDNFMYLVSDSLHCWKSDGTDGIRRAVK